MNENPPSPTGPQRTLPVELPANLEPAYCNLALIAHSPAEIVIDFARMLPAMPKARITSRVVLSPLVAKAFLRALSDNIAKYESQYGEIRLPDGPSLAERLFGKPTVDPQPEPPKEG